VKITGAFVRDRRRRLRHRAALVVGDRNREAASAPADLRDLLHERIEVLRVQPLLIDREGHESQECVGWAGREERVRDDLIRRPVDRPLQHDERRCRRRMLPDGGNESGQRGRVVDQYDGERVVRRGPRLPRRRAIRAIEHVGLPLFPTGVLPQHERLRIRELRKGARRDLEHAVGRILVQVGGTERNDRRNPGAFHVGLEGRAHERQRLVGAPLDEQVRAAPPLSRGHVTKPRERRGCREHRDNVRNDDRKADRAVSDTPPADPDHRRTSRSR